MATITFRAAQEVTGSGHLLESPASVAYCSIAACTRGAMQERIQDERFAFDPPLSTQWSCPMRTWIIPPAAAAGSRGFTGPVICTRATAELLEIMLNDRWVFTCGPGAHQCAMPDRVVR